MNEDQLAGEIMSSPVIACREEAFFEEVAELLAGREISGVPVVNAKDQVVGVISERDLAHALGGPLIRLAIRRPGHGESWVGSPRGVPAGAQRAKDIMTAPAVVAGPETPIDELARVMVEDQVNRIPIVRDKRLVGMVTRGDVLAAVGGVGRREIRLEEQPPIVIGSGVLNTRIEADQSRKPSK